MSNTSNTGNMNNLNDTQAQLLESKQELINALYDVIKVLGDRLQDSGMLTDSLQKYLNSLQDITQREGEKAQEKLRQSIELQALRGISAN